MAECLKAPLGYSNFDNNGGGAWLYYINVPITTIPAEYAQYKVIITANSFEIYAADGTLKLQDTTSGVWNNFWANVQSSGDDIRVFDQNKTQLYFWREEWDYTNQRCVIWVNLPANSTELNIAYGNPNALKSTYEDPNTVFEYFEDFDGTALPNGWVVRNVGTGANVVVTVSNSILTAQETGGAWGHVAYTTGFSYPLVARIKAKLDVDGNYYFIGLEDRAMTGSALGAGIDAAAVVVDTTTAGAYRSARESTYTHIQKTADYSQWQTLTIVWQSTSVKFVTEGIEEVTSTTNIPLDNMGFIFWVLGRTVYVDWVQILKLADPAAFGTPQVLAF